MKLLTFAESQRKIEPKKEEAKNVDWLVSFNVTGMKGVIIEAATHSVFEGNLYFYAAGEKVACAVFNTDVIFGVMKAGCAFTNKTAPKKKR